MTSPKFENRFNLTTLVAAANLALLLVGGGSAYATMRAESKFLHESNLRIAVEVAQIKADAATEAAQIRGINAAQEVRIRALELTSGRTEEKMNAILESQVRMERNLERLMGLSP